MIISQSRLSWGTLSFPGRLWRGQRLHCRLPEEEARVSISLNHRKTPIRDYFREVVIWNIQLMMNKMLWQKSWCLWTNDDGRGWRQDWKWKGWIFWLSWNTNAPKEYFDSHPSPLERPQNAKGFNPAFNQSSETNVSNPWKEFSLSPSRKVKVNE